MSAGLAMLVVAVIAMSGCAKEPPASPLHRKKPLRARAQAHDPLIRCPMHPDVVRNEPGDCPICGMALSRSSRSLRLRRMPSRPGNWRAELLRHPHDPQRTSRRRARMRWHGLRARYAEATGPEVRISPAVINNLGVRTESATLATLPRRAQTVGFVTSTTGACARSAQGRWMDRGAVGRAPGETVSAGQLLFTVYSPMLESAQQEYLDAIRIATTISLQPRATGCERSDSIPGRCCGSRVPDGPRVVCRSMRQWRVSPGCRELVHSKELWRNPMARIFDVIEYPNEMRDELVRRFPKAGRAIFASVRW